MIVLDSFVHTHVEKIIIDLKKRMGLLKRIKQRIPREKLIIIAEAIFNSKIRYGIAIYITPVFNEEDLRLKRLPKNTTSLQTLQNSMIRLIFGLKKSNHINRKKTREKIKMMSVNQMAIYHTVLEAHNVIKNAASDQIKTKWLNKHENNYSLRSSANCKLKIPEKPSMKCTCFTYNGAKLYNMLPHNTKEADNTNIFKALVKKWIWQKIPSY